MFDFQKGDLVLSGSLAHACIRSFARLVILLCCVPHASAQSTEGPLKASGCPHPQFSIVLDVGHTAEAGGATSARGAAEFSFNLNLAKRIESALAKAGIGNTYLLIMRGRGHETLVERSNRANRLKPSLFLSIHHDAVQDRHLQKWTYQDRVRDFSDKFAGYSIFVSNENSQAGLSLEAARHLGDELRARGLVFTRHHAEDIRGERRQLIDERRGIYRFDHLAVLRNTRAPAVLLEAGVIVNREEELLLASTGHQDKISSAVAAGVVKFCNTERH